jgi:predicted dehydrogenase
LKKVATGVIGLGTIGAVHAYWYSQLPESNLVAVCDTRKSVVQELESRYHVRGYTDYRQMLEDKELEALTIAVPHFLHSKIAIEAAKSGKHVAVEKPLCMTLAEAKQMINAVKKAGVFDFYTENLCFAPSYALAKEIVDAGGLGDVHFCKARESGDMVFESDTERKAIAGKKVDSWYYDYEKAGGGALMSTGVHAVQYVRYILGDIPARRVYAETLEGLGTKKQTGIEDAAIVTIRFEGNKVGEVETSFYATGGFDDKAEIYGNKGTILLDLYKRNPIVVHSHVGYGNKGQSIFSTPEVADRGWAFPIPDERYELGYYHEQRHFLQSILGEKRPVVNFDDGKDTLEIVLAAYESHRTGNVVSLPLTE